MKNVYNNNHSVETWKEIPGFNGQYEISSFGRVLSHPNTDHTEDKILKVNTYNGYAHIKLSRNGERKQLSIAPLVAKAFVDNPHKYKFIHFKDGNELNVVAENLEWVKSANTEGSLKIKLENLPSLIQERSLSPDKLNISEEENYYVITQYYSKENLQKSS